jgi:CubicO group peptidase (beta-lactamase class C family)
MRFVVLLLVACGTPQRAASKPVVTELSDPDGPHRAAVAALIQPLVDHEVVSGIVIGLYDAGKLEIYGFGKGPGGKPPTGTTLFEIGSITKVYTSLLLADAVQRREVTLDTEVSELLPPGVTMPTRDKAQITLRQLAVHASGLPRVPPSLVAHVNAPDPYAHYGEEALYADLLHTQLEHAPGSEIVFSNYGSGVLGFVLGRKIAPCQRSVEHAPGVLDCGYAKALRDRVLVPLSLHDTYVDVPAAASARRAPGTNDDLAPVPPWTFDALAGAGALVSTVRDQLALIDAEMDAFAGSKQPLRPAMRLTQEEQLRDTSDNIGLGWQIDSAGHYWHNGGTGGYRSYLTFDPKHRHGVVVLASTATTLVDHVFDDLYKVLEDQPTKPATYPSAAQLAALTGTYEMSGDKLALVVEHGRVYLVGQGVKVRLVPYSEHEFWVETLQSVAHFEDKRIVFVRGDMRMVATRVD